MTGARTGSEHFSVSVRHALCLWAENVNVSLLRCLIFLILDTHMLSEADYMCTLIFKQYRETLNLRHGINLQLL